MLIVEHCFIYRHRVQLNIWTLDRRGILEMYFPKSSMMTDYIKQPVDREIRIGLLC